MASDPDDTDTDAPLAADTLVGEFRIRGLLGEGAMGQVYLAQDTTLGRRVALKLIRRSVMKGDGIERFLEEARATASFNHPHIVTLHAVGQHDGRPFLALEYVDGESLRARMSGGPLPVREALRYCQAVVAAIAEAHRRGLVHADLKPENIVIPRDGRLRVVDFGLAKLVGGAPNSASGTPAYMAPERWHGRPPSGAIDIWALGVTLHELVTGSRPIPDRELAKLAFGSGKLALPSLPSAPWASLVRDCLSFDPAGRPSAEDVSRRIGALLDPRGGTVDDDSRCPFPGLAAFSRDNAADYFGRKSELDALVEQLRARPLIPIVGSSGVGKSSFVSAALIPRLDDAGRWNVIALRPGSSPFDSLAASLAVPGRPVDVLAEALRRHPDSLSLVLGDLADRCGARVLVFVDQFEETFTLAKSESIAFCDCLARAAISGEPWRIVLTVRDDFLGRLAESSFMRPHLGAVMLLGPLSAADLRAAVLGPLANAGYEADTPELVARIVDDVDGQPACLPLLQFACHSLWERREADTRRILTREYEAMGGATGALATHAQRFMAELTGDQIRLARSILLALVNADGTRRPRLETELLDGMPDGARGVIDRLLERRLVVATRDTEHEVAKVEVAHEALATAWPQLKRWLDETYEQRLLVAELEQASQLWQRRGRRDDETWGGAALVEAVRKVEDWHITLPATSRGFLDACVKRSRALRRRRRWLAGSAICILSLVAVAAVIAAIEFSHKEREAIRNRQELEANQERIRLAAADMGVLVVEIEPFDWDSVHQQTRRPLQQPIFAWQLRAVDPEDPRRPGRVYDGDDVRRGLPAWRDGKLVETIEARSGPAFLEVARPGCKSSRLYLQRMPGYTERTDPPKRMQVRIPTCQATSESMKEIPEGEFYRHVVSAGAPYDEVAWLPAFAIDITEVTRGAFDIYASMKHLTGDSAAKGSHLHLDRPGGERLPVVGVNFFTARNYCNYLGKALPTLDQWQRVFRGGLLLKGTRNPDPRRMTTWLQATSPRPANHKPTSGFGALEDVGSYRDDVSPEGVVDISGNAAEWSSSPAMEEGLRAVLGGTWSTPAQEHPESVAWRNARPDMGFNYDIGARCVSADH